MSTIGLFTNSINSRLFDRYASCHYKNLPKDYHTATKRAVARKSLIILHPEKDFTQVKRF